MCLLRSVSLLVSVSEHSIRPLINAHFPVPPDTLSSRSWPWSLKSVSWPHAHPVMVPLLGWPHPQAVMSAPPTPSMRTSLPLLSRWAAPEQSSRGSSRKGGQEVGCLAWPLFSLPDPLREAAVLFQPGAGQPGEAQALPMSLPQPALVLPHLCSWDWLRGSNGKSLAYIFKP